MGLSLKHIATFLFTAVLIVAASLFISRIVLTTAAVEPICENEHCRPDTIDMLRPADSVVATATITEEELRSWGEKSEAAMHMDWLIANQSGSGEEDSALDEVDPRDSSREAGIELEVDEYLYADQPHDLVDEASVAIRELDAEPLDVDWAHEQQYVYVDIFSSNQKLAAVTLRDALCKSSGCRLSIELHDELQLDAVLNELAHEMVARGQDIEVFIESGPDQALTNLYVRQ